MTLLELLSGVRSVLNGVAPAFIRDAVPRDANGKSVLPERCIIIDVIIDSKRQDFQDVYSSLLIQVGCWSTTVVEALEDLDAVHAALRGLVIGTAEFSMVRINGTQTDGKYRGVTADFTTLY